MRQTRVALLRATLDFAFACVRRAEMARDATTAGACLRHARDGYELASRLLENNNLGRARTVTLRHDLSALCGRLEEAEARQRSLGPEQPR